MQTKTFELTYGRRLRFCVHSVGRTKPAASAPIALGSLDEVFRLNRDNPNLIQKQWPGYPPVPYSLVEIGNNVLDLTSVAGQRQFQTLTTTLTCQPWQPPEWAGELWRFAELMQWGKFRQIGSPPAFLRETHDSSSIIIGAGTYLEACHSMNSDALPIHLDEGMSSDLFSRLGTKEFAELTALHERLSGLYGKVTLRSVVFGKCRGLPSFSSQVYGHILGVAAIVETATGDFVFVRRGQGVSINHGINVTTSGGADFDPTRIGQVTFGEFLAEEMKREAREELHIEPAEYDLRPVGFVRELPRGGSPEGLFYLRYYGSTLDLVEQIRKAKEHSEIDHHVYAVSREEILSVVSNPALLRAIHHKAVANLICIHRFLQNNTGSAI